MSGINHLQTRPESEYNASNNNAGNVSALPPIRFISLKEIQLIMEGGTFLHLDRPDTFARPHPYLQGEGVRRYVGGGGVVQAKLVIDVL